MQITKKQLRNKIEGVLSLAPFHSPREICKALLDGEIGNPMYPLEAIEMIMKEIKEEEEVILRNLPSDIMIIDEDGKPIEMVIRDGEKKKQQKSER